MRRFAFKTFKIMGLFFICLYSLIWLITPTASRMYSDDLLKLLSINDVFLSEESTIRYNPFISHLSIYDLVLKKKNATNQTVFSIKELHLEVGLYKLLTGHIKISEFDIDGLYIKVDINDEYIDVAGITLPNNSSTTSQEALTTEIEEDVSALIVKMDSFHLNDSKIEINIGQSQHQLDITSLAIERVSASAKNQQVAVVFTGSINQAPVKVSLDAQFERGKGMITADSSLSNLELGRFNDFLPENITSINGKINLNSSQKITLDEDSLAINIEKLKLDINNVLIQQNDLKIHLDNQSISSDYVAINLPKNQPFYVDGQVTVSLTEFNLTNLDDTQVLSHFKRLELNNITLHATELVSTVNIADIELSSVFLSDDVNNDIPPLALFEQLKIEDVSLSEQGLKVSRITLAGLVVDAQLDANKQLSNLIPLPSTSDTTISTDNISSDVPTTENSPQTNNENTVFNLSLDEFSFIDDAHINFIDNSITPIFERHIVIKTLTTGPINNQQPETKTTFELIGESDKYAHFNFIGFTQPFAAQPVYHLEGFFKELDLPAISTYMKEAIAYVFDSGQLDLTLDTTITGSTIDGNLLMMMRGIELTAAEDDEVNSMSDKSAIPFSVALGMLKDGDGNIELEIPLTGDTSDPSFGLSGFVTLLIKQATMSAAKDYLMTTFVPYANVISVAMTAGELLLKIRFNDLEFPASVIELQPQHDVFLAQFSALLKDKADEHITLCAIATAADIGKTPGIPIADKIEIQQLKKISLARMHAFKDYMVKTEHLDSSRLLLCTPQIDSAEDAKPRITFTN